MEAVFFNWALYLSLALCLAGLIWQAIKTLNHEPPGGGVRPKLSAGLAAGLKAVFSARLGRMLKIFCLDVLLQVRLFRDSPGRWAMHMAIFAGFVGLTLMHALGAVVMPLLDPNYAAPLNPYLWLRNLFGLLCLLGLAAAAGRRLFSARLRRTSGWADALPLILLAVILLSGFALEGLKIASPARYQMMVEYYADLESDADETALRTFWASRYGVVFPAGLELKPDLLDRGAELSGDQCAACHSNPRSAFLSWPLSRLIGGLGRNGDGLEQTLDYIHWLTLFLGLALLPFTKFKHILTTPLSLLVERRPADEPGPPEVEALRRAVQTAGCMHCGQCSARCSVAADWLAWGNEAVLPSEKLIAVKALARDGARTADWLARTARGSQACTSCNRCTQVCPAGIDLQNLWLDSKTGLTSGGRPPLDIQARDRILDSNRALLIATGELTPGDRAKLPPELAAEPDDFRACFTCLTCTNSCPVVAAVDSPADDLGLTPHQLMHCLGLGLVEEALGAQMVWDCLTCYACQEACPQNVRVADLLYNLRNLAVNRLAVQGGV